MGGHTYGRLEAQLVNAEGSDEAERDGHEKVHQTEPVDVCDLYIKVRRCLVRHRCNVNPQLRERRSREVRKAPLNEWPDNHYLRS